MPYPIEEKLVIAVASSALFDLTESDRVFQEEGAIAYRDYQEAHLDVPLAKGVAFPFVRRFLNINNRFPETTPVEVVLLSRNSSITGKRVFRSIEHHGLDISRAAFRFTCRTQISIISINDFSSTLSSSHPKSQRVRLHVAMRLPYFNKCLLNHSCQFRLVAQIQAANHAGDAQVIVATSFQPDVLVRV